MNVITFDGRLTKDAELKQLQTNTVCNFDVACNIGLIPSLVASKPLWDCRASRSSARVSEKIMYSVVDVI